MITYLAVPFDTGSEGNLIRGEAREAPDASTAKSWAAAMAASHVGAMALKRIVDDDTGADQEGELIAAFGEVDDGMLDG